MSSLQFVRRLTYVFAVGLFLLWLPKSASADSAGALARSSSPTCVLNVCGSGAAQNYVLGFDSHSTFAAFEGRFFNYGFNHDNGSFWFWNHKKDNPGKDPVAVPEPSSIALLGIGLLAVFLISRRRLTNNIGAN